MSMPPPLSLTLPLLSRIVPSLAPSGTQIASVRGAAFSKRVRLQGRRTSATTPTPASAKYFEFSHSKVFSRQMLTRFGTKTLDDAMLVLDPGAKNRTRRLDAKKRKQLGELYFENVASIICEMPEAAEAGVVVTKVEVPTVMKELRVHWRASGDERDVRRKETLEGLAPSIRRRLSESLYHSNVPPIVFVADRSELLLQEMNQLFQAADYGMQYRAVSHTAAVLGSPADSGKPNAEKTEKVPRFILAKRQKIEERKKQLQTRQEEETADSPSHTDPKP